MSSRAVETLLVLIAFLLALLVDMVATYLRWEGLSTGVADLIATLVVFLLGGYLALALVAALGEGDDDPVSLLYSVLAPAETENQ
ncbi:hypothetical protein [Haloarchaeobius amylolyticus]|uniref:hypothetical protein n=1 Tax=Haloarchaeobius amylolyticus TaxID=1198296 RepID=UPI00226E888D|nr:hypothetical protein [Haloarchaeobius amylolyticus]